MNSLKKKEILMTLFWPFSDKYGYTTLTRNEFKQRLIDIKGWINRPLGFEEVLYEALPKKVGTIKDQLPYQVLHRILNHYWNILDRDGGYMGIIDPL